MMIYHGIGSLQAALLLRLEAGDTLSLHEQAQLKMSGDQLAVIESGPVAPLQQFKEATLLPYRSMLEGLLMTHADDFVIVRFVAGSMDLLAMENVPADFFGARAIVNGSVPPMRHLLELAETFEVVARNETHDAREFSLELWGTRLSANQIDPPKAKPN